MKIRDLLKTTTSLNVDELKHIKDFLPMFEEFEGRSIEILENIKIHKPKIVITQNGAEVTSKTDPKLITLMNFEGYKWNDTIKLFNINLQGDDIIIRCTEDSIIPLDDWREKQINKII